MTTPPRSIDRKLQVLAKRIAESKRVPMSAPTDGLTSIMSTPNNNVANKPKGKP